MEKPGWQWWQQSSGRAQWRALRLKEQGGVLVISHWLSAKKCWLEAEGMQKVELEGESSGTRQWGNADNLQGLPWNIINCGLNFRNPSCPVEYWPWSKLLIRNQTYFWPWRLQHNTSSSSADKTDAECHVEVASWRRSWKNSSRGTWIAAS